MNCILVYFQGEFFCLTQFIVVSVLNKPCSKMNEQKTLQYTALKSECHHVET